MNNGRRDLVAVCSRSFSKNKKLRELLDSQYSNVVYNSAGINFNECDKSRLIEFISDANKAIVGLERIDKVILDACPKLEVVSKYGVGLDGLDLALLKERGIRLGWMPGINRDGAAELALALILIALRRIAVSNKSLCNSVWTQHFGRQLSGKVVGIIGFGHIGTKLAELLRPFNCTVYYNDILNKSEEGSKLGVVPLDFKDLLAISDIVSLHIPLNAITHHIINRDNIVLMKKGAVIVNAARGGLVDEVALLAALTDGHISAAAFDVFEKEPPFGNELLANENFFATSHIGGSSIESVEKMGLSAIQGLEDNFLITEQFELQHKV